MSELVWTGPKFPCLWFHIKSTAMVTHASMWRSFGKDSSRNDNRGFDRGHLQWQYVYKEVPSAFDLPNIGLFL